MIPTNKILELTGWSLSTLFRRMKERNDPFPFPDEFLGRNRLWDESKVQRWIAANPDKVNNHEPESAA